MGEVEIPPFFLCPISLEIMKDPVALSSGITYDRQSIEKWVFSEKKNICPVTKQGLGDSELTPNHTLRRLIQSWCTINSPSGFERFPTPKPPVSRPQILKLLEGSKSPLLRMKCLKRIKSIAMENETNKRSLEAAGAAEFLVSLLKNSPAPLLSADVSEDLLELNKASDEVISILYNLQLSETTLKALIVADGEFIPTLTRLMQGANYTSRTYAVLLLKKALNASDPVQPITLTTTFFVELAQILREHISPKTTKAALKILATVCPLGKNRIKAVEAGVVSVLIETLLDSSEKRVCEMVLIMLDQLCQCAEGRAEVLGHGAGMAVVSKKVLRVSRTASERVVRILHSIAKFSGSNARVAQDMLQFGVVAKLHLVLQVDCGTKTKDKAREILKLLATSWKNSPCMPMNLLYSYPL